MSEDKRVAIVGQPPLAIIRQLEAEQAEIIDLDMPMPGVRLDEAALCLPKVYCAILRAVAANAVCLRPRRIYIDVGRGKCDGAAHLATILRHALPECAVIACENRDAKDFSTPRCLTEMPLADKMQAICASVVSSAAHPLFPACHPTVGFWGVPPRDFSLLTLFPDTTHVFGWARCLENKTPDNDRLEALFDPEIPTVFFAQSFCAKSALARHLASLHRRALAVDSDEAVGSSGRAKIQAFLELNGVL
ncbi:MAG: hypothetical protein LBU39_06840 [Desulfobulbaceae bacterium]|jgi:hypothetical protein|nr:hypothetical protein [Desulfobulbaceae bacterium]